MLLYVVNTDFLKKITQLSIFQSNTFCCECRVWPFMFTPDKDATASFSGVATQHNTLLLVIGSFHSDPKSFKKSFKTIKIFFPTFRQKKVEITEKRFRRIKMSWRIGAQWPGRGRCYHHNFLRFSPSFCEIGVFLKNWQCYDPLFAEFSSVFKSPSAHFFADFFGENIF
jgi:hypothetical protein